MLRITSYYVLTTREDHREAGYWTAHNTKGEAMKLAQEVGGRVYRRTLTLTSGTETWRAVPVPAK